MASPTTPPTLRISLDQSIERMLQQLADLSPFLRGGEASRSLEEFDLDTERVIADLLGETSEWLEAYAYAEMGEAAGLVNMTDEAPEDMRMDSQRQQLLQRSRVLESCVSELEARRAANPTMAGRDRQILTGPQVAEHMSTEVRSVPQNASLQEAGALMQRWKTGSLLVTDARAYVGIITDSALAQEVVANGLDPRTTIVAACMRAPITSIEGDRPIIEAVRLMKDQATRHVAVTQDGQIIGLLSVSNVLRYYSGVV